MRISLWLRAGRNSVLFAIVGLLVITTQGCGDDAKKDAEAAKIPPTVQDSNKKMEDMMKPNAKK